MAQLGLLASLVYLVGNLFSMYIKSCFFRVFFETDASKKKKISKSVKLPVLLLHQQCRIFVFQLAPKAYSVFKYNWVHHTFMDLSW